MQPVEVTEAMRLLNLFRRLGAALLLALAGAAWSQPFPSRPITLVVPFAAGGPTDQIARVIAQKLGEQMGVRVVVEARPGANGNLGAAFVAHAPADGYTVLYNTSSVTLSAALYRNPGFDLAKDFVPVGFVSVVPLVLVVHPSVPVESVQEFIAYAKANPGKLSYGSAGNGNVTHLGAFLFAQRSGIEAVHIPYKGGAPASVDLIAGNVQFMTMNLAGVLPFVREKRMKALAITTARRTAVLPDVPTLAESGMPGFDVGAWQGVLAPAGTPKAVVDRLNLELQKALASPEIRAKLAGMGAEIAPSTPEFYAEYLKKDLEQTKQVVKAAGIMAE